MVISGEGRGAHRLAPAAALLRADVLGTSTCPPHYPPRPLCKLKSVPERNARATAADGRHRRRHLAVRRRPLARLVRGVGDGDGRQLDGSFISIDGTPHFLSSTAAAHLLELAGVFELVWASGWEERANEHLPHLLGLPPELPFLRFERAVGRSNAHWKLDAIEAYADGRPLAWIDDALTPACHEWADAALRRRCSSRPSPSAASRRWRRSSWRRGRGLCDASRRAVVLHFGFQHADSRSAVAADHKHMGGER